MNFIEYGSDDDKYEQIYWNISNGGVHNMLLVVSEGNLGSINYKGLSCHGYYIIKFYCIHIHLRKMWPLMDKLFVLVK